MSINKQPREEPSLREILIPEYYSTRELLDLIESGVLVGLARQEAEAIIVSRGAGSLLW